MNRHWGVRILLQTPGLCRQEAESSCFQPQHLSDRACGILIVNHWHSECKKAEKGKREKGKREKNAPSEGLRGNISRLVPKLS